MVATINLFDDANVLQTVSSSIDSNVSTTATAPTYATLMSASITTQQDNSFVAIFFSAAPFHTGPFTGNVAMNFRFKIDGSFFRPNGRGTTVNTIRNRIMPLSYVARTPVTGGLHTVSVEWGKFSGGSNAMEIRASTLPDLFHGQLIVQEHKS